MAAFQKDVTSLKTNEDNQQKHKSPHNENEEEHEADVNCDGERYAERQRDHDINADEAESGEK